MKNISIKGLFFGFLTSIGLDIIFGIVMVLIFPHNAALNSSHNMNIGFAQLVFSMITGLLSTVGGGYVAAKFGKLSPYKNAASLGVFAILLGLLLNLGYPLWFNFIGYTLTIPAALLGALIYKYQNTQQINTADPPNWSGS